MLAAGAHAATDITGFGLLGHAHEVARASGVRIVIDAGRVPVLPLVRDLVARGVGPGGSRRNAAEHAAFTVFADAVPAELRLILSDAQTSGGLLIFVAPERAATLRDALAAGGVFGAEIGAVEAGTGLAVQV
jgi:selenide,water dikinase